jgi:hypothetical protein
LSSVVLSLSLWHTKTPHFLNSIPYYLTNGVQFTFVWGCVLIPFGRALAWHARGQRFDPAILHQKSTVLRRKYGAFLFLCRKKWGLHCLDCIVFRCFAGGSVQPPSHWCFGRSEGAGSADDLQHLIEHLFHLPHQRELGAGAIKVVAGAVWK